MGHLFWLGLALVALLILLSAVNEGKFRTLEVFITLILFVEMGLRFLDRLSYLWGEVQTNLLR